ncbi:MAG: PilZ domain-containing protein [Acidobacteriota bacterium]
MREQRAAPRRARQLRLEVSSEPQGRFEIQTLNISLCGAHCRSRYFLPVMTRINVTLLLPEEAAPRRLDAEAVVVRVQPCSETAAEGSYDMALYFTRMKESDQIQLSRYLQSGGGEAP